MLVNGRVTLDFTFDEFMTVYKLLWKMDRATMTEDGMSAPEMDIIFGIRVKLSSFLTRETPSSSASICQPE